MGEANTFFSGWSHYSLHILRNSSLCILTLSRHIPCNLYYYAHVYTDMCVCESETIGLNGDLYWRDTGSRDCYQITVTRKVVLVLVDQESKRF
jgi:hypothetical protein